MAFIGDPCPTKSTGIADWLAADWDEVLVMAEAPALAGWPGGTRRLQPGRTAATVEPNAVPKKRRR
jgi:hypothetical protein